MTDPTPEQKAEALARLAADRAAELALRVSDRATEAAVERAVKDANVDRDLREHAEHLKEIDGSQRQMAKSLNAVEKTLGKLAETFDTQTAVTTALAAFVKEQATGRFSRRTLIFMGLTALAGYIAILTTILMR